MTAGTVDRKGKRRQRLRWYLFGPLAGAAAITLFCYGCAVLLERGLLPADTIEVLSTGCVFAGAVAGGAAGARRRGAGVLEAGLLCGASLAAVLLVAALIAPGDGPASAGCLRAAIASVAGGAFGGSLCLNRGRAKRRKSRRGRR